MRQLTTVKFDAARYTSIRDAISASVQSTLPEPVSTALIDELALLLEACERWRAQSKTQGLLTYEGRLRVVYRREYNEANLRIEKLMKLLGIGDARGAEDPAKDQRDKLERFRRWRDGGDDGGTK